MENKFFKMLRKKNALDFVEPSSEIKDAYVKKSQSNLESSKLLLENNKIEEAVTLAYYGMYNICLALLFRTGIKSKNHAATIDILEQIFGINTEDIQFAKKERINKQYYHDFEVSKADTLELIKTAEKFVGEIYDFLEKLNSDSIGKYRSKFLELLNEN